ncbi:DgyrCDS8466 [Dimorphilus gyrociliatus]|uniref:Phosphatidate cytidylyltransferase, mitochondrial n=1 Tax=Dimorphilus gyrociliatus TaxID=2664684 RepID=A0A7I8VUA3_9ANNE|nr:DgyrCDS8466 [Dimorphilus gyrociliatus]
MSSVKLLCEKVLPRFSQRHINLAFAYGSGVFQQNNQAPLSQQMLDIILIVSDAKAFHKENLDRNRKDYSFLKYFGADKISHIQQNYGAKVFFNTLVPIGNKRMIKYGIIQTDDLLRDLFDWETLYIAGRLHKPVLMLNDPEDYIEEALKSNLKSALNSATLLLPRIFDEITLYKTIASLSYTGDFRMVVGEDRDKIENIVRPNFVHFQKLYQNLIEKDDNLNLSNGMIEQNLESSVVCNRLISLPRKLARTLVLKDGKRQVNKDIEDIMCDLMYGYEIESEVRSAVKKIVSRTSSSQSVKGIFSAGMLKSLKYSGKKLNKWLKSIYRSS